MSNYIRKTKNSRTGRWENAEWLDDHFGRHKYGVRFSDGTIYNPEQVKLKTK